MENSTIESLITEGKIQGRAIVRIKDLQAFEDKAGMLRLEGLAFAFQALLSVPQLTIEQAFKFSLDKLNGK